MSTDFHYATQRTAKRCKVTLPCQVVTDPGFRLIGSRVLDLSENGMLVASEAAVDVGQEVVVSMRAPRSRRWIDAIAKVCRVVRGRRVYDPERAIALEFTEIEKPYQVNLRDRLSEFPQLAPQRRLRVDYASSVYEIFQSSAFVAQRVQPVVFSEAEGVYEARSAFRDQFLRQTWSPRYSNRIKAHGVQKLSTDLLPAVKR